MRLALQQSLCRLLSRGCWDVAARGLRDWSGVAVLLEGNCDLFGVPTEPVPDDVVVGVFVVSPW